jgi:hypothetical protein
LNAEKLKNNSKINIMATKSNNNDICCPKFDPTPWNEKVFEWKDKKFVKDSVFTIFYMPVNFGGVMRKLNKKVREANTEISDGIRLSDHTSKWNMDIYLAVNKEIPGTQNTTISGTFVSKVYEGPFSNTGKWHRDFAAWCTTQGHKTVKIYMWYTTCPKCAKKYGKNYVVILAEIEK